MGFDPLTMMAISAGVNATGAYGKAKAEKSALNARAGAYDAEAQMAVWQQDQAMQDGVSAEQQTRNKFANLKSTQRASLAANGVDLGEGSANDILAGTDLVMEQDATQLRMNAMRTAWGYENKAIDSRNQAAGARAAAKGISPALAVATSLLGSAGPINSAYGAKMKTPTAAAGGGLSISGSTPGPR